jgi:hypothetical protein
MKRGIILTIPLVVLMIWVGLAKDAKLPTVIIIQSSFAEKRIDSVSNYEKFKAEADVKISDNRQKIAMLKTKASSDDKEESEKNDLKILAVEQKNNEMETRIRNASDTRTNMWLVFMREFKRDMTSLEYAIKELGI